MKTNSYAVTLQEFFNIETAEENIKKALKSDQSELINTIHQLNILFINATKKEAEEINKLDGVENVEKSPVAYTCK